MQKCLNDRMIKYGNRETNLFLQKIMSEKEIFIETMIKAYLC